MTISEERNDLIAELHRLNTCRNSRYKTEKWKRINQRIKEIDEAQ